MTLNDIIEREYKTTNWVIARRTQRIINRYGQDVVCLTSKKLRRLEKQLEIETADEHPAYPWLKRLFGNHCDAVNIIRGLREEGFRIEKVAGE